MYTQPMQYTNYIRNLCVGWRVESTLFGFLTRFVDIVGYSWMRCKLRYRLEDTAVTARLL